MKNKLIVIGTKDIELQKQLLFKDQTLSVQGAMQSTQSLDIPH